MRSSTTYRYGCSKGNECSPIPIVLSKGMYFIECWGAQGGTGLTDGMLSFPGGKGAYVSGYIHLLKQTELFLFIGGMGSDGKAAKNTSALGGWNGGGTAGADITDNDGSGGGGGATDVRLINGLWSNSTSLRSRIMVAAGGSGSCYLSYGSPGGDLYGYKAKLYQSTDYQKTETSQTSGYAFGYGAYGSDHDCVPDSGGGGGYYGGIKGNSGSSCGAGWQSLSSSGSSFVSGYPGCNAINSSGNHTGSTNHYSGLVFNHAIISNGFSEFPSIEGPRETGHEGNGAIKITIIQNCSLRHMSRFTVHISSFLCIILLMTNTKY